MAHHGKQATDSPNKKPLTIPDFVKKVAEMPTNENCLNMYAGQEGRAQLANLEEYLKEMVALKPKFLFAGLAAGPNGALLTGIPFVDSMLLRLAPVQVGPHSVLTASYVIPPALTCENSSYPVWSLIRMHNKPVLVWNVLPRFPLANEQAVSLEGSGESEELRRNVTRKEIGPYEPLMTDLLDIFNSIRFVVGIGGKATATAKVVLKNHGPFRNLKLYSVPHPSSNKQNKFLQACDPVLRSPNTAAPEYCQVSPEAENTQKGIAKQVSTTTRPGGKRHG